MGQSCNECYMHCTFALRQLSGVAKSEKQKVEVQNDTLVLLLWIICID